jgi:hypothetical protein
MPVPNNNCVIFVRGLLGGHVAADVLKKDGLAVEWYNNELLDMAKDIGERLMPAFNTSTGIPYPKVMIYNLYIQSYKLQLLKSLSKQRFAISSSTGEP